MTASLRVAHPRSMLRPVLLAVGLALLPGASAAAKPQAVHEDYRREVLNPPDAVFDEDHHLDLHIEMLKGKLYNPASGRYEDVDLRSYVVDKTAIAPDLGAAPGADRSPFIAPTMNIKPGDVFSVTLHNGLGPNIDPTCKEGTHNGPHCFNTTNLHTHGLWVSPADDDVMTPVLPGDDKTYTYHLPETHPSGTMWYHPHQHGATTIQVGSGAVGALIVKGNRKPVPAQTGMIAPGDIDTLLAPLQMHERILMLQQIQYACYGTDGKIKTYDNGTWKCDEGDVGVVRDYGQLSPRQWRASGRFTSINGEIVPIIPGAVSGRIERWRMVDAGLVNTIGVEIREMKPGAPPYAKLNATDNAKWVRAYCTGPFVHQFSIATDGLTRPYIVDRSGDTQTVLQPGYRDDVLVVFPRPGRYCVTDGPAEASGSIAMENQPVQLLGVAVVGGGPVVGRTYVNDQTEFVRAHLIRAAALAGFAPEVLRAVDADLRNGMKLTSFLPHQDLSGLSESEMGKQELAFNYQDPHWVIGTSLTDRSKDKPFNPNVVDRTLIEGTVDQWTLTSLDSDHPFHIHINPFQIQAIYKDGIEDPEHDVSVSGEPGDSEYANLKGAWKDTILVKEGYYIVIRSKYERFTGRFVLHCHILSHEDNGMMELIQIVSKDAKPDAAAPAMPGMGH